MRSVKGLLGVMLEHQKLFTDGLCHWSRSLYFNELITYDERILLKDYIINNRPSKYSSLSAYINRNSSYYWKDGNIIPRIEWIKKQLEKL